jgi:hypothetical protein
MITAIVEKQALNVRLSRKVAAMSDAQRYERLQEIADATDNMSYEHVLEFAKLLIGPDATLSDE